MARRGRFRDITFDAPPEEEKKNEISYMQPEILPVQFMETILKERGISSSALLNADRKTIVKIFYKHISPKYQREYRENRRGKILKKARQKRERKIDSEDWKKLVIDPKDIKSSSQYTSKHSSSYGSSSRDRLKPPPCSYKSAPKSLDEIIIKEHKPRSNREEEKEKDRDKRKGDGERQKDDLVRRDVKKIKLSSSLPEKRKHEDSSSNSSQKIKLKHAIKWP
ncbi:ashwin-like [Palaemon carinicauda]|uniref:ashwin-like n=1 Tax=Palaemon carinicauda TaxID=392227 RepID=UPI0035B5827A